MRLRALFCTLLLASSASAAMTHFSASPFADAVIVADGQEKPVSPNAQVGMVLSYDDATNIACGHVTWSGLSGKPTAIHVHIGAFDKNTTVRYAVPVPAGDALTGDLLFRLKGNADFGTALKNAGIYGDVHTVKYPNGEVRDTFLLEQQVTADCDDRSPLLVLDGTATDAGTDASTPTPTPTATSTSPSTGGPEAQPGRTAPTTEDETTPADSGGCNVATGTADLSIVVLAGIGVVVARRKRRRIV